MNENIAGLDAYGFRISKIMNDLDCEMSLLDDDTNQYKDRQYLHALLDIVYGATESNYNSESRLKNLDETQRLINRLEVME